MVQIDNKNYLFELKYTSLPKYILNFLNDFYDFV